MNELYKKMKKENNLLIKELFVCFNNAIIPNISAKKKYLAKFLKQDPLKI